MSTLLGDYKFDGIYGGFKNDPFYRLFADKFSTLTQEELAAELEEFNFLTNSDLSEDELITSLKSNKRIVF